MFDWLRDLIHFLISLCPRLMIIAPHEAAVLLSLGKIKKDWDSGWYIWWPIIHDVYKIDIMPQIVELGEQSFTTKDGKSIVVQSAIEFEIFDQRRAIFNVNNYSETLYTYARSALFDEISNFNWEESNIEGLLNRVKIKVARKARKWGVKVTNIWFTTVAEHRLFRIMSDAPVVNSNIISEFE